MEKTITLISSEEIQPEHVIDERYDKTSFTSKQGKECIYLEKKVVEKVVEKFVTDSTDKT